jgi:uncharacterized caspase-like protein
MLHSFTSTVRSSGVLFTLLLLTFLPATAQEEGKRVALIIGNNSYAVSPLRNAVNDARLMDKVLRDAGFKTILKEDASYTAMEDAAAKLAEQLGPDDTALFFYAGHGVQIDSENFLVPVDFEPTNTIVQAKFKCFKLSQLFEELKKRTKRAIIILDACRSNPIAQGHSLQAGLAQPQVSGNDTFIAFSTGPGQVAADNPSGRDSWFTEALGDLIQQPGLSLDDVFTRVKARVSTETESRQSPWTISSLTSTFYFHPPTTLQTANDPSVAEKWMLDAQSREQREEWEEAINLTEQVIKRKPGGALEMAANSKLPYLILRKDAREKYEMDNFKEAAALYSKAFTLDPFSVDTAFQAIDSYLLDDHLPEAVQLLSVVYVRGTSASVQRANAMLKELGAVYPEAARVIKTEQPSPPAVQELFAGVQFGVPDWSAGLRSAHSSPVPLGRWATALEAAYPPPPDPASTQADKAAKVENDLLHVEVNSSGESRDLSISKIGEQSNAPTGSLLLMGSIGTAKVLANGQPRAEQLPATVTLPPGKYKVAIVEKGTVTGSQDVEVIAFQTKTVMVQRNK